MEEVKDKINIEIVKDAKDNMTCENCHRSMLNDNFYMSKRADRYPTGRIPVCKKCLTMHVNNWEPSTFLNILEKVDVPYIESEWNVLLDKYGKDPKKLSSTSIIGRYLSKMKLRQFQQFHFSDTQMFKEKEDQRKAAVKEQEDKQRNRYAAALDNGAAKKNIEDVSQDELEKMSDEELAAIIPQIEMPPLSFEEQVTSEEKQMLSLKWGKLYQLEEWVKLEQFYTDMMNSYDIQTAAHKDYLKKISKTSLKMDQAIDCGDIEGFQKLSKVYDALMKSAKFTAAQNKAESDNFIDSIGEMVALCEEKGFIPKYHTDEPKDIVDITIRDMNGYTNKLIKDEMNLGDLIESAALKMRIEDEKEEGELDESDEFVNPDMQEVLEDVDFNDFNEFKDAQAALDDKEVE